MISGGGVKKSANQNYSTQQHSQQQAQKIYHNNRPPQANNNNNSNQFQMTSYSSPSSINVAQQTIRSNNHQQPATRTTTLYKRLPTVPMKTQATQTEITAYHLMAASTPPLSSANSSFAVGQAAFNYTSSGHQATANQTQASAFADTTIGSASATTTTTNQTISSTNQTPLRSPTTMMMLDNNNNNEQQHSGDKNVDRRIESLKDGGQFCNEEQDWHCSNDERKKGLRERMSASTSKQKESSSDLVGGSGLPVTEGSQDDDALAEDEDDIECGTLNASMLAYSSSSNSSSSVSLVGHDSTLASAVIQQQQQLASMSGKIDDDVDSLALEKKSSCNVKKAAAAYDNKPAAEAASRKDSKKVPSLQSFSQSHGSSNSNKNNKSEEEKEEISSSHRRKSNTSIIKDTSHDSNVTVPLYDEVVKLKIDNKQADSKESAFIAQKSVESKIAERSVVVGVEDGSSASNNDSMKRKRHATDIEPPCQFKETTDFTTKQKSYNKPSRCSLEAQKKHSTDCSLDKLPQSGSLVKEKSTLNEMIQRRDTNATLLNDDQDDDDNSIVDNNNNYYGGDGVEYVQPSSPPSLSEASSQTNTDASLAKQIIDIGYSLEKKLADSKRRQLSLGTTNTRATVSSGQETRNTSSSGSSRKKAPSFDSATKNENLIFKLNNDNDPHCQKTKVDSVETSLVLNRESDEIMSNTRLSTTTTTNEQRAKKTLSGESSPAEQRRDDFLQLVDHHHNLELMGAVSALPSANTTSDVMMMLANEQEELELELENECASMNTNNNNNNNNNVSGRTTRQQQQQRASTSTLSTRHHSYCSSDDFNSTYRDPLIDSIKQTAELEEQLLEPQEELIGRGDELASLLLVSDKISNNSSSSNIMVKSESEFEEERRRRRRGGESSSASSTTTSSATIVGGDAQLINSGNFKQSCSRKRVEKEPFSYQTMGSIEKEDCPLEKSLLVQQQEASSIHSNNNKTVTATNSGATNGPDKGGQGGEETIKLDCTGHFMIAGGHKIHDDDDDDPTKATRKLQLTEDNKSSSKEENGQNKRNGERPANELSCDIMVAQSLSSQVLSEAAQELASLSPSASKPNLKAQEGFSGSVQTTCKSRKESPSTGNKQSSEHYSKEKSFPKLDYSNKSHSRSLEKSVEGKFVPSPPPPPSSASSALLSTGTDIVETINTNTNTSGSGSKETVVKRKELLHKKQRSSVDRGKEECSLETEDNKGALSGNTSSSHSSSGSNVSQDQIDAAPSTQSTIVTTEENFVVAQPPISSSLANASSSSSFGQQQQQQQQQRVCSIERKSLPSGASSPPTTVSELDQDEELSTPSFVDSYRNRLAQVCQLADSVVGQLIGEYTHQPEMMMINNVDNSIINEIDVSLKSSKQQDSALLQAAGSSSTNSAQVNLARRLDGKGLTSAAGLPADNSSFDRNEISSSFSTNSSSIASTTTTTSVSGTKSYVCCHPKQEAHFETEVTSSKDKNTKEENSSSSLLVLENKRPKLPEKPAHLKKKQQLVSSSSMNQDSRRNEAAALAVTATSIGAAAAAAAASSSNNNWPPCPKQDDEPTNRKQNDHQQQRRHRKADKVSFYYYCTLFKSSSFK